MKKLIFLTIISLFLLGCGSVDDSIIQQNFKEGISQVEIRLLENTPPDKIYQNSEFAIVMEIDNQAAYPVTEGVVTLLGIDNTYIDIFPLSQQFPYLEGRSILSPTGDRIFFDFDGNAKELYQKAEQNVQNYFIKAQYKSNFDFGDTICINTDLYQIYDGGCKTDTKKSYSGQGAPIAITGLEQITSPGSNKRVEFRFSITNRGNGKVLQATLNQAKLGREEMTCIFQGKALNQFTVKFDEKQETVLVCSKPLSETQSYQTTISLSFNYVYELSQEHRLTLVK